MKIPLHDYQKYAMDFAKNHPFCGLFLEMGLGKTSIVLETLWELNPSHHVLIIAPKTIARCTWDNEIIKWNLPIRTKSLLVNEKGKDLTKKKRMELYDTIPGNKEPTVYFINREKITDLVKRFPENKWPFPFVIIDESQSFKAYNTERFKALKSVRPYMQRLILLTGSPAPNGLMDLWSQIYLLDMGARLGNTITTYRNVFFDPGIIVNNYPVEWRPKKYIIMPDGKMLCDEQGKPMPAKDLIYRQIDDIVISMKNKYIKLPPVTYNHITATLLPDEKKIYQKMMKENVLTTEDGTTIEAVNAAVLSAKLSQMASGALYTDAAAHKFVVIHKQKLELCEHIIRNTDSPVIIAYHFQSDKAMLLDYFSSRKDPIQTRVFDGSPEMEKEWNRKEIPVMLIQPASCGFGLNLQEGGHTLIWYTIPWSLEHYEQTNARIYRQGQRKPVIIHHLIMEHTIDTKILKAIEQKNVSQKALMDAIEATIHENQSDYTENTKKRESS